ncbi:unnamed protein product [Prorocentrum cordatum]|uniref:Uncharacterized protein n=1 Tax=Prorocentrum cordatum TaxID=2364126 RepID=A0ABN9UDI9_9DINO|nr:unnamed protein product [Polarella glacialis]
MPILNFASVSEDAVATLRDRDEFEDGFRGASRPTGPSWARWARARRDPEPRAGLPGARTCDWPGSTSASCRSLCSASPLHVTALLVVVVLLLLLLLGVGVGVGVVFVDSTGLRHIRRPLL